MLLVMQTWLLSLWISCATAVFVQPLGLSPKQVTIATTLLVDAAAVPAQTLGLSPKQATLATTLVVHVVGIRANTGAIRIGFYDSAEKWQSEKSNFQRFGYKESMRNGRLTLTFTDVKPGHYGAAIVDDENDNGHIDWGLMLPKEGFGFSNYEHRGLLRPDYEDFDFDLVAGSSTEVTIKVRYL